MKRVGLFIPCYIDDFYPDVAMATLEVLEANGFLVEYPPQQSCCGQPFINNGLINEAKSLADKFFKIFKNFDYIVAPSSSCISTVKHRYKTLLDRNQFEILSKKSYELCEFLYDIVGLDNLVIPKPYRGKVGIHNSCHAVRELNLVSPSELKISHYSKIKAILQKIDGLLIYETKRDECCGFGGTFSVAEPEISVMMGRDRIKEHLDNKVPIIVGVDMSCLMHLEAIAKRDKRHLDFYHISQILVRGDKIW